MKKNILGVFIFSFVLISVTNAQNTAIDGLVVDKSALSTGVISNGFNWAIKFGGTSSGEAIASPKAGGTNINGLDFYTNFLQRLRILNNGNIGLGSYATPTTRLSFGPYTQGTDLPMRLAIFDNTVRAGLGYFEVTAPFKRVFAFYMGDPTQSRFGFFDDYTSAGVGGYEFVTFNNANRSVGICNTNPSAKLHVVTQNSDMSQPTFAFDLNQSGSASSYPRLSLYQNFSTNPRNHLDATLYTVATNATTAAPLYLQTMYGGNVGIGYFGSPISTVTYDFQPQSKLQIQQGALQITNSGDAATQTTGRTGLIMGHLGDKSSTATNSYSWIQSSKGPLLLNPLAANSLTDPQTNNYVAIGYTPTGAELTTLPPVGYNLLVKGKVMCEELKIKLKPASGTAWPDYVFASDYKLMTVDSLQSYIAQNNHLPDVPSAAEVEENGIMAGQMNAVLLKKIEELTLYMIEQNAENAKQSKAMSVQDEQIKLLKEQNDLLMQQLTLFMQQK